MLVEIQPFARNVCRDQKARVRAGETSQSLCAVGPAGNLSGQFDCGVLVALNCEVRDDGVNRISVLAENDHLLCRIYFMDSAEPASECEELCIGCRPARPHQKLKRFEPLCFFLQTAQFPPCTLHG